MVFCTARSRRLLKASSCTGDAVATHAHGRDAAEQYHDGRGFYLGEAVTPGEWNYYLYVTFFSLAGEKLCLHLIQDGDAGAGADEKVSQPSPHFAISKWRNMPSKPSPICTLSKSSWATGLLRKI
ncbi:hypothetical protein [Bacteroides uniformis]|uniref:hypothetical protein n=1 Tax=Bacteroides uniformis TaxID=820 RepID=UPI0035659D94